jgi:hypothetical protein
MTRTQLDSFLLFLLGCVLFVGLGVGMERISQVSMLDFKELYYGGRCFLQHCDPYREADLLQVYRSAGADRPSDTAGLREVVTLYINLPTFLVLTTPFAMLPRGPAHLTWMILTAACFILAAYLMWSCGADAAPAISGALVCVFLYGAELLLEVGNGAGIAVGLCVIAVWCFLRERFVWAGTLCFALSLLMKPHVTGPILLYFLLTSGENRKRALRTIAIASVLGLFAVLWVSHVLPHWNSELHANLQIFSAHGGLGDAGPAGLEPRAHGATTISLQTVFSLVRDSPGFYNPASYLVCAPLLLIWAVTVFRRRFSLQSAWLALAAVAALSMLPLYHRQHDTRLLLLTIPALAVLWAEGGLTARLALLLTAACAVLTANLTIQFLADIAYHLMLSTRGVSGQLLNLALVRPAPLILLVTGTFYLWAYVRYSRGAEAIAVIGYDRRKVPARGAPYPPEESMGWSTGSGLRW